MITIIDYEIGNMKSVFKLFEHLKQPVCISKDPKIIEKASLVVLPGVGAFKKGMAQLQKTGLNQLIKTLITAQKPFLGICLGFQLLFESSEENDGVDGLGIFKGTVKKLPDDTLKVPHMGWNQLFIKKDLLKLFSQAPSPYAYFIHSFAVVETDPQIVCTQTDYGVDFVSSIQTRHLLATQFHPEKSGSFGIQLISNFIQAVHV